MFIAFWIEPGPVNVGTTQGTPPDVGEKVRVPAGTGFVTRRSWELAEDWRYRCNVFLELIDG